MKVGRCDASAIALFHRRGLRSAGLRAVDSAPRPPPAPSASAAPADPLAAFAEGMRAYHAALAARRLGSREAMSIDDVRASSRRRRGARPHRPPRRSDRAPDRARRAPRASSRSPRTTRGARRRISLGDALASAGAYAPARAYLRRLLTMPGAWDGEATYAHRAARRLVEIGLETERWQQALGDLAAVPPTAREETRGEVLYVTGRAREAAGDPDGALAAYAQVAPSSRFWSQATYLRGLISVEHGRWKEGEDLFCKVADPKRQDRTAPVFADERFFAVRDLARLALGRVAHEAGRFDDARYYYYLVPRDSDRLAEALYEAATTRYEKKDYEGARELLDELKALQIHHRYEDEAWILDSYIDLAQCKFPEADKKLVEFLARYEPVRDAARRVATDEALTEALLRAAHAGSRRGEHRRRRREPGRDARDRGARPARSGVRARGAHGARSPSTRRAGSGSRWGSSPTPSGAWRRTAACARRPRRARIRRERASDVRAALDGVKRQIDEARGGARGPRPDRGHRGGGEGASSSASRSRTASKRRATPADRRRGSTCPISFAPTRRARRRSPIQLDAARRDLAVAEGNLAARRDAPARPAPLAPPPSRAPRADRVASSGASARSRWRSRRSTPASSPPTRVDSLDAARYLQDNEEYWPFEGDDWPDEFVGGEVPSEAERCARRRFAARSCCARRHARGESAPRRRRHPREARRRARRSSRRSKPGRRRLERARRPPPTSGPGSRPEVKGPRIPEALKAQLQRAARRADRPRPRAASARCAATPSSSSRRFVNETPRKRPRCPRRSCGSASSAGRSSARRYVERFKAGTRSRSTSAARRPSPNFTPSRDLFGRVLKRLPAVRRVRPRALRRRLPRERAGQARRGARPLRAHPRRRTRSSRFIARRAHVQGRGALQPEVRLRRRAQGVRGGPQVQRRTISTASRSSRARGACGASGTPTKPPKRFVSVFEVTDSQGRQAVERAAAQAARRAPGRGAQVPRRGPHRGREEHGERRLRVPPEDRRRQVRRARSSRRSPSSSTTRRTTSAASRPTSCS